MKAGAKYADNTKYNLCIVFRRYSQLIVTYIYFLYDLFKAELVWGGACFFFRTVHMYKMAE